MNHLVQQVKNTVVTHMPGMLTGVGIASFISASVLAATATPKAIQLLEEKKEAEKKPELDAKETIQTVWKCYIPTAVMIGVGTGCVVGSLKVSERRQAAWATAYSLSETAFREYQDKMVEKLGERKEKQARDEIAQEKIDQNPPKQIDVIQTGRSQTICKDLATERTFTVDIDDIAKAEKFVKDECKSGCCSWNDFYYKLDVSDTSLGAELGWNIQKPLERIIVSSCLGADGAPMLAIDYKPRPFAEYWKYDDGTLI